MTDAREITRNVPVGMVIGWDVENWSRALPFWQDELRSIDGDRYCLELGCGSKSTLSLWLAALGHRVLCSDRNGVDRKIKELQAQHPAGDRITYGQVDARAIGRHAEFDIIVFKSVLGGIAGNEGTEAAREVIASIATALKPGGMLLFAENLSSTRVHEFARRRFGSGKDGWRYFTINEIRGLLSAFSEVEIETFGFLGCFGRSEFQRKWLGRIDRGVAERVVPRGWHYVAAVVARK